MAKTELTSLQKRILTSLIMIPIVIGALQSGHPYVDILVFIVGAMLSWEWASMVPNKKSSVYAVCYTFAMGCSLLVFNRWVLIATIALTTLFVFIKAKEEQHRKLLTLGSSLKEPKLAPKISPNKTWSGLVGGVILAVAVSFIYMFTVKNIFNLPMPLSEQLKFAQLGAMIAIVAQIGDLAESAIKRHLGVKDSSSLIPGHGGVFDRIDGLIFAAPIVYCYFTLVSLSN